MRGLLKIAGSSEGDLSPVMYFFFFNKNGLFNKNKMQAIKFYSFIGGNFYHYLHSYSIGKYFTIQELIFIIIIF
jgi:hypothetical protein